MSAPSVSLPAPDLAQSYAWCQRVARKQARNFYYSFLLLPRERRAAMCAVYAFMRYCDDLSDSEDVPDRPAAIARWSEDLKAALAAARAEILCGPPSWIPSGATTSRTNISST